MKSGLYVRENKDLEEGVILPKIWHLLVNGRAELWIEVCLIPSAIQYSPLIILYYKYWFSCLCPILGHEVSEGRSEVLIICDQVET